MFPTLFMSCHFPHNVAPQFLTHAEDWLGSIVNNLRVPNLTHIVCEAVYFWPMIKKGFDPCCRVKLVQISPCIFIYTFEPIHTCFELWDSCASGIFLYNNPYLLVFPLFYEIFPYVHHTTTVMSIWHNFLHSWK